MKRQIEKTGFKSSVPSPKLRELTNLHFPTLRTFPKGFYRASRRKHAPGSKQQAPSRRPACNAGFFGGILAQALWLR